MNWRTILMLGLAFLLSPVFATAQHDAKKAAAAAETVRWLTLVDAGKYGESWQAAAGYFQNAVTMDQWAQSLLAVRKPLGKRVSRTVQNMSHHTSLPGAPDGEYVVIQYATAFANKASAVETVTATLEEGGHWKVVGYFIK